MHPSSSSEPFDRNYALTDARSVIEDIGELDRRNSEGALTDMPTRLVLLAGDYDGLADDGVPPGVDPAHYVGTLTTLSSFTTMASNELSNSDFVHGSARYQVVRKNTIPLLAILSKAFHTKLKLS